ncbi:MAG: S8 family peptidase [candidate division KSB1 bacterium]|nr:S8 family peptidase [candidate division KSB1 bacterium]
MKNYLVSFCLLLIAGATAVSASEKVWIFFEDKGPALKKSGWTRVAAELSERAKSRRAKVTPTGRRLVDQTDRPVYQPYLNKLTEFDIQPVVVSRWLNAASVRVSPEQKQKLLSETFISHIQPVLRGRRKPVAAKPLSKSLKSMRTLYEYGPSLTQNELINVPETHTLGLTGKDVLIGVFDSGFKTDLPVFEHLNIVDTRDFIYGDNIVENESVDVSSQHNHGTSVLSLIGGFHENWLIAPAFEASFLLAKTEDIKSETEVEEDFWIAAAEWAEQQGADIITTSLGYIDWYEPSDADGDTAPITRAADLAVKKGIVVIASAGNEGNDPWTIVTPPADGDSVIAVGAVDLNGMIAGFSSRGPTADGRIKPDVVAMGSNCTLVRASGAYSNNGSGTSYAAPQVAAAVALILQAHPELTPMQVRQALVTTADRFTRPDNIYGFGLIDVLKAVKAFGPVAGLPDTTSFVSQYPNPFYPFQHGSAKFMIDAKSQIPVTIDIHNILGQKIASLHEPGVLGAGQVLMWTPERTPANGIYIYRVKLGDQTSTGKFTVLRKQR